MKRQGQTTEHDSRKREVSMGMIKMNKNANAKWTFRNFTLIVALLFIAMAYQSLPGAGVARADYLIHSSDRFSTCTGTSAWDGTTAADCTAHGGTSWVASTRKWTAGWGVTGGQYGVFDCSTCHQARATNIKGIKGTITAVLGGVTGSVVVFSSTTNTTNGFGDDTVAHTTSQKICEVCHSRTKHHDYSSSSGSYVAPDHNSGKDCATSCHLHKTGFAAGGACNSCHGKSGTTGAPLVGTDFPTPWTGATGTPGDAGAHARHTETLKMGCSTCHANMNMSDSKIQFQFQINSTNYSGWTGAAAVTSGTYSGNASLLNGYTYTLSGGTLQTIASFTPQSCGIYCHGRTLTSGSVMFPKWNAGASAVVCGSCHGVTGSNTPTAGSHQRHASTGTFVQGTTKQGLGLACSYCHGSQYVVGVDNPSHIDGNVDWALYTTDPASRIIGSSTYSGVGSGNTGTPAPSAAYKNCNNIYCHSNVQNMNGSLGTTFATPTWGTADLSCDECHGQALTTLGTPSTGSHRLHVQSAGYLCSTCHQNAGSETTNHATRSIQIGFNGTIAGSSPTPTYSKGNSFAPGAGAFGKCSATWCHGSTSFTGTWGANTTNAECTKCHGLGVVPASYTQAYAAPGYNGTGVDTAGSTNSAAVGAHNAHVGTTKIHTNLITCDSCHNFGIVSVTTPSHNDHALPAYLKFGVTATANETSYAYTPAYNGTTKSCSNVYCHGNMMKTITINSLGTKKTPTWTDKSYVTSATTPSFMYDCQLCHKSPPPFATGMLQDHTAYAGNTDCTNCKTCHEFNADCSLNDPSGLHVNGVVNGGGSGCGSSVGCHTSAVSGVRTNILSAFTASSHHAQGSTINGAICYNCHWEADSVGNTTAYHQSGTSGSPVQLVVWTGTTRPTTTGAGANIMPYTASLQTRTEFAKINSVCLGCHNDTNATNTTIFGDGKTPTQYAWDTKSVASKYSSTMTTSWGKYVSYPTYSLWGVAPKNITKAFSAHGNAAANTMGWDTTNGEDGTLTNFTGSTNVLCFDCHNSHGSSATTVATSYAASEPAGLVGGNLKNVTSGLGGYSASYVPLAGGSTVSHNAYNAGAALCFDCHMNSAATGTRPWGYGTFGASKQIIGYSDTPYFGSGQNGRMMRYAFKNNHVSNNPAGGHFGHSSTLNTTPLKQINGICTPCHDPHGVSSSITASNYAVPLLKGTWLTSPYKEDAAPASATVAQGGGNSTAAKASGSFPGYHLDQNTFSMNTATTKDGKPDWSITAILSSSITETAGKFAGLCLQCHQQTDIASTTTNTGWKTTNRVHNSVKGWGTIGGNNGNAMHSYTCSKCHVPHNSGLPRLLVTNCLDWKHRGRVASGATAASTSGSTGTSALGHGRFPSGGGGYSNTSKAKAAAKGAGWAYYFGIAGTSAAYPSLQMCHDNANTGAIWPTNQFWNSKTPW
jgi:predicted CxxxxCH...CXXCH cytochrome family protein